MLKKFLLQFWTHRDQFIRYFIIGVSAYLLDIGTLYVFKEHLKVSQTIGVILNQPIIIVYVFLLNRLWSFKSTGLAHRQLVRFFLVAGSNYLFSAAWIWLISEHFGVQYLLARTLNIMLAISWNFLLYKYWVYKEIPKKDQLATPPHQGGARGGLPSVETVANDGTPPLTSPR